MFGASRSRFERALTNTLVRSPRRWMYVSRMQVSHQKSLAHTHVCVYDGESYSRFSYFRCFDATALRITRVYVCICVSYGMSHVTSNRHVTATVKCSIATGARASRFGLSSSSTRPIVPSIVHKWGKTIRTGCSRETARFLAHPVICDTTTAYVFHGAVPNRGRVANLSNCREKLSRYIGQWLLENLKCEFRRLVENCCIILSHISNDKKIIILSLILTEILLVLFHKLILLID